MDLLINLKSFRKGIKLLEKRSEFFRPKWWTIKIGIVKNPWIILWTPSWHENRGPYVSIGLLFLKIYRGY